MTREVFSRKLLAPVMLVDVSHRFQWTPMGSSSSGIGVEMAAVACVERAAAL